MATITTPAVSTGRATHPAPHGVRLLRPTRRQARELLQADAYRRVFVRAAKLLWGGLVAMGMVWNAAFIVAIVVDSVEGPDGVYDVARVGDFFSATVDPVLPALVGALLALAVIKAGGFAPGFIIGASTLIGGMAVMWALLTATALIGAPEPHKAMENAVSAAALTLVCVVVSIAVSELLPLSEQSRRRQLRKRADQKRDAAVRLRARLAARPVLAPASRPYSPASARRWLVGWYLAAAIACPASMLAYALPAEPDERGATFVVATAFAFLVCLLVGCCQGVAVVVYETPDAERRRVIIGSSLAALACAAVIVTLSIVLTTLLWPIPLLAIAPLVLVAVVLFATVAPLLRPMPRWGLLAQVAPAHRLFGQQWSGWRADRIVIATKRLRRREP
jgi:hypothetical protein